MAPLDVDQDADDDYREFTKELARAIPGLGLVSLHAASERLSCCGFVVCQIWRLSGPHIRRRRRYLERALLRRSVDDRILGTILRH
jgi:hypothetical protein